MSDIGQTRPAGDGVDDSDMAGQVTGQTDSDLLASDVFERDAGGVENPTEAAKAGADEIAENG